LIQVQCQRTDLFQIDSFRLEKSPSKDAQSKWKHWWKTWCRNQVKDSGRDDSGLHQKKTWRSVIEIIAQDQIREFANHPYFLMLITDKW
jgi:hypothetical protein